MYVVVPQQCLNIYKNVSSSSYHLNCTINLLNFNHALLELIRIPQILQIPQIFQISRILRIITCTMIKNSSKYRNFRNFGPIKSDLSGNTARLQASGLQKVTKMDHFWHF